MEKIVDWLESALARRTNVRLHVSDQADVTTDVGAVEDTDNRRDTADYRPTRLRGQRGRVRSLRRGHLR